VAIGATINAFNLALRCRLRSSTVIAETLVSLHWRACLLAFLSGSMLERSCRERSCSGDERWCSG
jgi:hypothetical protein